MNEQCIERCAPKRDASEFQVKDGIGLADLPRFPLRQWQQEMISGERQVIAGVYLAKVVDQLQGRQEDVWTRSARPDPDRYRGRRVHETFQAEGLSHGSEGKIPHLRIGRNLRIRQSELVKWLEEKSHSSKDKELIGF